MTSSVPPTDPPSLQFLVFDVGGALYAMDSRSVREIVPSAVATRIPGAPPHVRGLVNLRGTVLTVVDLSARLAGAVAADRDGSTIIIHAAGRLLGVAVDDVHDVRSLPSSALDAAPSANANALVRGLGHFGDEVVIVVDVPELIRQTLS